MSPGCGCVPPASASGVTWPLLCPCLSSLCLFPGHVPLQQGLQGCPQRVPFTGPGTYILKATFSPQPPTPGSPSKASSGLTREDHAGLLGPGPSPRALTISQGGLPFKGRETGPGLITCQRSHQRPGPECLQPALHLGPLGLGSCSPLTPTLPCVPLQQAHPPVTRVLCPSPYLTGAGSGCVPAPGLGTDITRQSERPNE